MKNSLKKTKFLRLFVLSIVVLIAVFVGYNRVTHKDVLRQNPTYVFKNLEHKKDGIYFFYFPECPWCKEIMPVLKKEAVSKNVPVIITNIHDKKYSQKEKNVLKQIIQQTNHVDGLVVPFFVVIDNHKIKKAQIGLISPEIKDNRSKRIKKEVDHLLTENFRV
jgi:thiol-disulfide isomerase/thioredoxin